MSDVNDTVDRLDDAAERLVELSDAVADGDIPPSYVDVWIEHGLFDGVVAVDYVLPGGGEGDE